MKTLKQYYCESNPTDEEINQALEIVKTENNCVVLLHWFVDYNGWHRILVDGSKTLEELKNRLPKIYGM